MRYLFPGHMHKISLPAVRNRLVGLMSDVYMSANVLIIVVRQLLDATNSASPSK